MSRASQGPAARWHRNEQSGAIVAARTILGRNVSCLTHAAPNGCGIAHAGGQKSRPHHDADIPMDRIPNQHNGADGGCGIVARRHARLGQLFAEPLHAQPRRPGNAERQVGAFQSAPAGVRMSCTASSRRALLTGIARGLVPRATNHAASQGYWSSRNASQSSVAFRCSVSCVVAWRYRVPIGCALGV